MIQTTWRNLENLEDNLAWPQKIHKDDLASQQEKDDLTWAQKIEFQQRQLQRDQMDKRTDSFFSTENDDSLTTEQQAQRIHDIITKLHDN